MTESLYRPRSDAERAKVAEDCLRGANASRHHFAREIVAGELFDDNGVPKSYWHCLATLPPPNPTRRGQWIATPGRDRRDGAQWVWQAWT